MPVFVILILFSLSFYIFYKIKFWRMKKRPNEKRWIGTKASIALGLLLIFFGFNELYLRQSTATVVISIIFICVGGLYVYQNYRLYRYYLPLASRERQDEASGGQ